MLFQFPITLSDNIGLRFLIIWANCFFFKHVFSFEKSRRGDEKSRRGDDNQQITVSHLGEHKRLHLKSSKQNYYIISCMCTYIHVYMYIYIY